MILDDMGCAASRLTWLQLKQLKLQRRPWAYLAESILTRGLAVLPAHAPCEGLPRTQQSHVPADPKFGSIGGSEVSDTGLDIRDQTPQVTVVWRNLTVVSERRQLLVMCQQRC